jgi:hypothetical protein
VVEILGHHVTSPNAAVALDRSDLIDVSSAKRRTTAYRNIHHKRRTRLGIGIGLSILVVTAIDTVKSLTSDSSSL